MSGVKRNKCAGLNGKICRNQPEKSSGRSEGTEGSRKARLRFYCKACLLARSESGAAR